MTAEPETYYFPSTGFAPNNRLPVLVYRGVLPDPINEESTTDFLTMNKWHKLVRLNLPCFLSQAILSFPIPCLPTSSSFPPPTPIQD